MKEEPIPEPEKTEIEVRSYIIQVRQAIELAGERTGEDLTARPHTFRQGEDVSRQDGLCAALHFLGMAERHLDVEITASLVMLGAAIGLAYSQGVTFDLIDRFAEFKNMEPANKYPA